MHSSKFAAALVGVGLLSVQPVFAHGFAGPHMFISTLLIDDPNVADEASLPTFSFISGSGRRAPRRSTAGRI